MFVTLFYRKCRKYMRFGISLCIFWGDFWPPFWWFRQRPKKRPYRRGREKKTAFFINKNCFFAFNFEAFPECNPIFGDLRQETFMAARLKPNLRMAESTLRKAGSTADAAQQNFQIFCFFLTSFFVFFLNGARTARCFFPAVRAKRHFSIPSRRSKFKTKKTACREGPVQTKNKKMKLKK